LKGKIVGIIFAAGLIIALVALGYSYFEETPNKDEDPFSGWIESGPFHLNKVEYKLGESIFMSIGDLAPHEIGGILIIRPNGEVYNAVPFDATIKTSFNYYWAPELSIPLGICDVDDLLGTWKLVFDGVNYDEIPFEVIDEFIPGEEIHYEPVC